MFRGICNDVVGNVVRQKHLQIVVQPIILVMVSIIPVVTRYRGFSMTGIPLKSE